MSDRKAFIPMSIEQRTVNRLGYFFSPMKSVIIVGSLVPGLMFVSYAYSSSGNSIPIMLMSLGIYIVIYTYIIRFFVFEERRLKRLMNNLDKNKISNLEYFWGINTIDDNGVIHYRYNFGLKKGVVVKIERGSLVGIQEDFADEFNKRNIQFVRSLLKSGFSYDKHTRLESRDLPKGLLDYQKRLENIEDDAQRTVIRLNLDTISNFVKDNKSVMADYYVIYNKDIRLINTFKGVVEDIVNTTYKNHTYFKGSRILDGEEVVKFMSDNLNVKSVSKEGYYDDSKGYTFSDFGEVFRLFNDEGEELLTELVNDFKEEKEEDIFIDSKYKGKSFIEDDNKSSDKDNGNDEDDVIIDFDNDSDNKGYGEDEEIIYVEDGEEVEVEDGYEYIYVDEEGNPIDVEEIEGMSEEEKEERKEVKRYSDDDEL